MKKIVIILIVAVIVIGLTAVGAIAALNSYNYSIGTRTGVLDKLSRKGITCWTTEGQLALRAFARPGTLRSGDENIDNTFYFSVPDSEIQKKIESIPPGSPVTLEYHQKLFTLAWPLPFLCKRRTQYEIVGVEQAPALQTDDSFPQRPRRLPN